MTRMFSTCGRQRTLAAICSCLIVAATAGTRAHDFWIEATAYRPAVGALVGLRLLVGERMLGDPVTREPEFIDRFVVARGSGEQQVPGRDGGHPAGILRVDGPGLLVVGYESKPRPVELTPEKFEQYLGEEGLDEIRTLLPSGRATSKARELFSRCAKALLLAGPASGAESDRALGLTFELVSEKNPYAATPGEELPFRLTYRGRPKAGALVIAISQQDASIKLSARSDRQGRIAFRFPRRGVWLVKAVHMVPGQPGAKVDWQSFWASITFELPR